MRGILSFHAVDLDFFDRVIGPLTIGEKVNPDEFLDAALRVRKADWHVKRYRRALERLLELLEPPPPPEGGVWHKLRSRLERLDYKPDPTALLVAGQVEPDLHLYGRPFLIFEKSTDRVSDIVDEYSGASGDASLDALVLEQLLRIDARLGTQLEPFDLTDPMAPLTYRNELLAELKSIYTTSRRMREGPDGASPDASALRELAWHAVQAHARAVPFWIGRDVDGLETLCDAAGIPPPGCLAPAWRLFPAAIERLPELRDVLTTDLSRERDVGAFVSADDIPELIDFLNADGARIIQAATRHGVGAACSTLLRKIRECAHHARRHGRGYLEASGVWPAWFDPDDDLASDPAREG